MFSFEHPSIELCVYNLTVFVNQGAAEISFYCDFNVTKTILKVVNDA